MRDTLTRAPAAVGEGDLCALHLAVQRLAKGELVTPAVDVPVVSRGFIGSEQPRIDGDLNGLRLARLELDLSKSTEAPRRLPTGLLPVGGGDIDLRDAFTIAPSRIAHGEARLDALALWLCRDRGKCKASVAETMTEGEEGTKPLQIIPFVPDRRPFIIGDAG